MSAIAALKGYRTQFLYSLHRIVFGVTDDYVYHIEGEFEDLDIIDNNGKYVECLQVKNLSDSLTFSDLFSAKDSFFKRIIQVSSTNPNVIAKVISFGSVSDELSDKKKLGQKLKSKGFHDNKIQTILAHYTKPMLVSEKSLYNDIVGKLKTEHPFIDPVIAVELLLSWICFSAEKQIPVTRITLLQEIQRIGIFVQERIKFHSQYGSTIIPLQVKNIDSDNIQLLKEGYISGISAKYEHILAGLDVIRYDKLNEINKAFATNNIVFVHGASGQGKSSLAYRYLSNNYIDGTMFELKLSSNFNDVRDTINSLDGLCKGLNIPVIIYIDVLPDNNHWNEVVKEFSNKSNLMFLITLRQETWNKTLLGEDYSFKDIELIFDKEEARSLYNSISKNEKDLINASFEESWMRFGNKGLLLEYMYFLNHGDKLKNKLGNQVLRLETDQKITELKILRYVCLADLYNSKVNCKKLIDKLGLDSVLAQSYITNLEKEYLLEHIEDSMYLSGMHYVRSEILCEILFDENKFINKTDYINALISLVNESDLHSFLLNSFDNNYDVISLFKEIKRNDLHFSWVGVANILKALLWKGVYDFVFVDNYLLFEGLYKKLNSGWFIGLPYDYSGTMDGTIYNSMRSIFKKMNPEILVFFDELSQKFSPKDDVYQYAKQWLSYLGGQTIDIASNADISAIGIYCFWAGHLGLTNNKIIINNPELIKIANNTNTSIEDISELIFGLESYGYSKEIISSLREFAIKKLREKYTSNLSDYVHHYTGFSNIYNCRLDIPEIHSEKWVSINDNPKSAINLAKTICTEGQKLSEQFPGIVLLIFVPNSWSNYRQFNYHGETFDLHNYIKAFAAQHRFTTQFIEEKTLYDKMVCEISWWLSLALFVKALRTPWTLADLDQNTAYAGIGYSIKKQYSGKAEVILGCSHIYNAQGQGLRYKLSKVEHPQFDKKKNPYLNFEEAYKFGMDILALFQDAMEKLPQRVVVHKRTPFKNDEIEGITNALKQAGISEIDLITITQEYDLKFIAEKIMYGQFLEDGYPVDRGTCIKLSSRNALLWTHGVVPSIQSNRRYYQGGRCIPAPLKITKYYGHGDLETIAKEILGFTKMNWNSFNLYTKLPATIDTSNTLAQVGNLLRQYNGVTYDYRFFI